MRQTIYILTLIFVTIANVLAQLPTDSIYKSWWANKDKSIFQNINKGTFSGTTNGYLQLKNGKNTIVLDFQMCKTKLNVIHDPNEMYDKSTKVYSTQTTSGKTTLTYQVYALANIMAINLNGLSYQIGIIDGASDTPILGLTFNYCSDKKTEYLTLFVTKPLELTTTREVMKQKKIYYSDAEKLAKKITLLPGSTLVFTLHK